LLAIIWHFRIPECFMLAVLDPGVYLTLALPTGEGKLFTLALVIEGR
jgi:hypothetical protein